MRALASRLMPGTDLKAKLGSLTEEHALRAAFILSCVGSLSTARLRMPGAIGAAEVFKTFVEPMGIVSLTGTLCPDDLHVHIGLARPDGACIGGHLAQGCVIHTTAPLVIGELAEVEFSRTLDPVTRCRELTKKTR